MQLYGNNKGRATLVTLDFVVEAILAASVLRWMLMQKIPPDVRNSVASILRPNLMRFSNSLCDVLSGTQQTRVFSPTNRPGSS